MKNILNKYYVPYDNSYCVEYTTNKESYLLPWLDSNEFNSTKEEIQALFTIVSMPYTTIIKSICGKKEELTFINVKSSTTDKVYRVLFNEKGICDTIAEFYHKVSERNATCNSEMLQWFTSFDENF